MAYISISIKPYIKSHLELQREITLIELAPSPYFFVLSICLAYMNMFARLDENSAMTLQDIKVTKPYRRTHARTDGQREMKTVYPSQSWGGGGGGGYNNKHCRYPMMTGVKVRVYVFFGYIGNIYHDATLPMMFLMRF